MKKLTLLLLLATSTALISSAYAQFDILGLDNNNTAEAAENKDNGNKTDDVLNPKKKDFLNEYMDNVETEQSAKDKARDLLSQKPNILILRDSQQKLLDQGKKEREKLEERINKKKADEERAREKKEYIQKNFEQAPFGLFWDISPQETQDLEFEMTPAKRADYEEVYLVKNKSQQETFEHIMAIYGTQQHLWCIYAQSRPITDKSNAEEILKVYKKYYNALDKKYGNAQEFFKPYKYTEEIVEETDDPKNPKITRIERENPLGGPTFLEELRDDKASLYAVFDNGKIGVTLSVFADKKGRSYISLDFKNLSLMHQEKEADLSDLINDL